MHGIRRNITFGGYLDKIKYLEHLWHNIRPEIKYIEKFWPLNRLGAHFSRNTLYVRDSPFGWEYNEPFYYR